MKRKGILAAFAAALVAAVLVAAPASRSVEAKGPVHILWDAEINGGAAIPGVGSPVSTTVDVGIDQGGVSPSDTAFLSGTRNISAGIAPQPGPNKAGGPGTSAVGAKVGSTTFQISTNVIAALAGIGNIPGAGTGTVKGLVPRCGDNNVGLTKDWTNDNLIDARDTMITTPPATFSSYAGNMAAQALARPHALYANHPLRTDTPPNSGNWVASEYGKNGVGNGVFIQSYDDDTANGATTGNGIPDSEEGSPANEPAALGGVADPWAISTGGTYIKGAPQTQHDYNGDGIPNGIQSMPDFLPVLVDALGLNPFWVARTYGIADPLHNLVPPTDVHFLLFAGVPGQGGVTFSVLANPYSPALPSSQATTTCTPFSTAVGIDASSSAPNYGKGVIGAVTVGDAVQKVSSAAPGSMDLYLGDANDYDQDGLVASAELCAMDSTTNADPDNDLLAGKCDPNTAVADASYGPIPGATFSGMDLDGDGFINNVDNCPIWFNPSQADRDLDGVGDTPVCDTFVTTDTITGAPAGKGSGLLTVGNGAIGATLNKNTSALLNNDLLCVDSYTTTEALGDAVTSCANVPDANDNGVSDALDSAHDSDGDGISDAAEITAGTNPVDPLSPYNPAGDYDKDGCTNAQELQANVNNGGGAKKNPLNYWDNFDVNGDGGVDLSDTLVVLSHFGHSDSFDAFDQGLDRAQPDSAHPEFLVESDDDVDLSDALNSLAQFGISCGGVPGTTPANGGYIGS